MPPTMTAFLRRVEDVLEAKRMSKSELAKAIGVSRNTVYSWFHNDRAPRVDEAIAIADAIDTDIMYLLYGYVGEIKDVERGVARITCEVPLDLYHQMTETAIREERTLNQQMVYYMRRMVREQEEDV